MSDLRDALNEAFTSSEEPVSAPEPAEPSSPPAETTAEPVAEPAAPEPSSDDRARDALGRFTKPDQADGKGQTRVTLIKPPVALPDASQPHPALPTFEKPPRDVPIMLRSHWTALTPEWRQHISETHQKLAKVEEQYQPSVEFTGRFLRTIQPFQQAIQIEAQGDPIAAVQGLMEVANTLRFGSPVEKANRLAAIISHYGVDIDTLDKALEGSIKGQPLQQPAGFNPQVIRQAVQQELAPLLQGAQQRRQEQTQKLATEIQSEFEKFAADPKNEYFEDVRMLMADVLEVAEKQGYQMSNEDAYQRACMLHPEVSKIMLARQRDQSAQNLTQAAQRAKAAAVSVKGAAPVGNPAPTAPSSVREAIEAAIEEHSRV
jgi:hypothetical protein